MKLDQSIAFAITAMRRPVCSIQQQSHGIATTHQETETL